MAAFRFDYWPANDARGFEHQGDGGALRGDGLPFGRKLAPSRAFGVEKGFPANCLAPGDELFSGYAVFFVIMEMVGNATRVEPGEGFFHRRAILDAIDLDHCRCPFGGRAFSIQCAGEGDTKFAHQVFILRLIAKHVEKIDHCPAAGFVVPLAIAFDDFEHLAQCFAIILPQARALANSSRA